MKSKSTNTKSNKQGRRSRDEARQEILDTAVDFLWEHPFRDLTVPELMKSTSIGRSSFYVYFRDRYHLIEALLNILDQETNDAIVPWLKTGDNPFDALFETAKGMVDVFLIQGPIIRAIYEAAPLDSKLDILWNGFLKKYDKAVEAAIIRDQKAGLIGPLNPAETAHAVNRMDMAYLIERFGRRPQADPKTVFNTLFCILSQILYGKIPPSLLKSKLENGKTQSKVAKKRRPRSTPAGSKRDRIKAKPGG